ncbi:MAG: hypothetical protein IKJ99_06975 [Oscillospiraceae bacterium]|nr:hypothetical protein [Oscillospiraceae bacterium]
MNENEFNLDFDFEKEYGFDLPKDEPIPETDEDFDLDAILAEHFTEEELQFDGEYTANFDYGPELEELPSTDPLDDPYLAQLVAEEADAGLTNEPAAPVEQTPAEETPAEKPETTASGKPRKPISPIRKFKNEMMPLIILGVSALLILIFIIGAAGRAITAARNENDAALDASESQMSEAQRLENEAKELLGEAAALAAGYDYQGAIDLLNTFSGDASKFAEIDLRKSEYEMAKSQLVAHNDPGEVANLSFHVLIADPSRAFKDETYGGSYNKNFVTTDEFEAILNQLYENDFVLVDMDSFIAENNTGDKTTYESKTLYLPEGKKPFMITETYGYLQFMVDSNEDGEPDKNGGGFASRLVIDENGEIKAEMVDADGNTVVGNYALVPILNDFIEAHPDFCYQGSRAIIATTGYSGIFGYRTMPSVIESKGQEYYDAQVEGAKKIADALRADGYEIACYTYENVDYGKINADSIQADLDKWNKEVTSIIGPVDVMVYAKESDISSTGAYSGSRYTILNAEGFRYFITSGTKPAATVAGEYVRQVRIMVTGTQMAHAASTYTNYFDAKAVLNSQRGNVPQN